MQRPDAQHSCATVGGMSGPTAADEPGQPAAAQPGRRELDALTVLLVTAAGVKIVAALALVASHLGSMTARAIHPIVLVAHVLVFGGAAVFLAWAGRRDRRAVHLGVFFLLVAVSFANGLITRLVPLAGAADHLRLGLLALHPDAFLPWYLWRFVRQFPRLPRLERGPRFERLMVTASLAAGVLLFVASAWAVGPLAPFAWAPRASGFDAIMFGLAIPALPYGLWKARRADVRERRRYRLFVSGLALGFLPIAAQVFAEATWPAYAALFDVPPNRLLLGLVLYPLLLSIPVTTAYAVVVHRVMDVKVIVRRAVQYALARYTIIGLAAAPAALLVITLVRNRDQTIGELANNASALSTSVPLGLLLAVLAVRRPLLERIDRIFFREAVDTRTLMGRLATSTETRGDTLEAVCRSFSAQVLETLHLAQADVLVTDPETGRVVAPSGRLRPLALDGALGGALAAGRDPMVVELDQAGGWVQRLPLDEQQWLADGDVHLLMPLRSGADLIGVMALGEKLNDLPFSGDDRALLAPVAAALALKIENLRLRQGPASLAADGGLDGQADALAVACGRCGAVAAEAPDGRCAQCGGEVAPAQLPAVLAGKFRLERELGRGGMGVVYLAFDTALERRVAIKTLPRVSLAESVRLRREARAMAGFAHPHLALVFGLETWRGSPALVMEYLDGGTLADRLRRAPMPPLDVAGMAHDLAGAIAHIHDDGLLHRDIKPSNIAFTRAGTAKLLDFGLAQIFVSARPVEARTRPAGSAVRWLAGADLTTVDHLGRFAGTPAYMAPEAVGGDVLDGTADLWSFGVVLYECLTGQRPFADRTIDDTSVDWVREIQGRVPECPAPMAHLVADLLAADRRQRPPSAHAVRKRLLDQATLRVA
jgi:hypothetical protein